jgi:radical SAM superfamily enzyme YgiQ (UPF0313 family)
MKRAGCLLIGIGVETGSARMLDSIHKRITLDQVLQSVRYCKELGLKVRSFIMFSLPDETDEDRRLTFEFMKQLLRAGIDDFTPSPTTIFPGTDVEKTAIERGVLPKGFSWSKPYYNPKNAAISPVLAYTPLYTESLSLDGILKLYDTYKAFRRTTYIARSIRNRKAGLAHSSMRALRYIWGFTKIRSRSDLAKHLILGREVMIALRKGRAKA